MLVDFAGSAAVFILQSARILLFIIKFTKHRNDVEGNRTNFVSVAQVSPSAAYDYDALYYSGQELIPVDAPYGFVYRPEENAFAEAGRVYRLKSLLGDLAGKGLLSKGGRHPSELLAPPQYLEWVPLAAPEPALQMPKRGYSYKERLARMT